MAFRMKYGKDSFPYKSPLTVHDGTDEEHDYIWDPNDVKEKKKETGVSAQELKNKVDSSKHSSASSNDTSTTTTSNIDTTNKASGKANPNPGGSGEDGTKTLPKESGGRSPETPLDPIPSVPLTKDYLKKKSA